MAQEVEHLPGKCKARSSNSNATKRVGEEKEKEYCA
jgi:hypothetical protein